MYAKLDSLIVGAVEASRQSPIHNRLVAAEGKRIADESGRDDMRVIDGRLQALRRAGKIAYYNKSKSPDGEAGWYFPANAELRGDAPQAQRPVEADRPGTNLSAELGKEE